MVALLSRFRREKPPQGPAEAIELATRLVEVAGSPDRVAIHEVYRSKAYTQPTRIRVMWGFMSVAQAVPSVAEGLRPYAAEARSSKATMISALYALDTDDLAKMERPGVKDTGTLAICLAMVIAKDPDGLRALERWKQITAAQESA